MKKILMVIARLNVGGTSKYLYQLSKNLPKKGYQVRVLTGDVQGNEKEDTVVFDMPIVRLPHLGRKIHPLMDILARNEIRDEIIDFKPDIIYSHTFKAGLLVRTLKLSQPVIHAFHGHSLTTPEFGRITRKALIGIEKKLAPRSTKIVTVGEKVGKDLLQAGIGKKDQYISIAPGVSLPKRIDKSKAKSILGINDSKKVVVSWLGRFTSVKGPERVIEIAKRIPDAIFVMAGGGELFDGVHGKSPSNLILVGWQDSNLIYSISDLVINTSLSEGMPVTLIEAQLAGLPVIAIDHGSVSETVSNNVSGLVFSEFGNDFIKGVETLVCDDRLRKKLGNQAKILASEKFLPDVMIQEHIKLFESVIRNHAYKPHSS